MQFGTCHVADLVDLSRKANPFCNMDLNLNNVTTDHFFNNKHDVVEFQLPYYSQYWTSFLLNPSFLLLLLLFFVEVLSL